MDELGVKLKVSLDEGLKNARNQLDAFIKEYSDKTIKFNIDSDVLKSVNTQLQNFGKNFNSSMFSDVNKELDASNKQLTKQSKTWDGLKSNVGQAKKIVEEYSKGLGVVEKQITNISKNGVTSNVTETIDYDKINKAKEKADDDEEKRIQRLELKRIKAIETRVAKEQRAIKQQSDEQLRLSDMVAKVQDRLARIGNNKINQTLISHNKDLKSSYEDVVKQVGEFNKKLQSGNATIEDFKKAGLNRQINKLSTDLDGAKQKMGSFTAKILTAAKSFTQWYILGNIIAGFKRSIQSGIDSIIELDSAMVELRKVTDETEETYRNFYYSANNTAKALGVTTQAVVEATSAWSRMGYSIKEASKLAEVSAIFSNISEDMNIEESTQTLVSILKAFKIDVNDSLDGIVSKVNEVGNKFALTNKDIADILSRSSSAMSAANNTLEETIALGVAGQEIVQSSEVVGTALKTLSMRIRGLDEDTGETDESLKEMGKTIKGLTGVSIMLDANTYKSTYQILKEISEVFDKLTDKQQAETLKLLFGLRQGQVGSAILTNFEAAEKAIQVQAESAGGALREQETYMNSLSAKINEFRETVTGMWQGLFDTDALKFIVSTGTLLIKILDGLLNKTGALIPILTTSIGLYITINLLKKSKIALTIKEMLANIKNTASTIAQNLAYIGMAIAARDASSAVTLLGHAIKSNPLFWGTVAITAIYGLVKLFDALTVSLKEQREEFEKAQKSYEEATSQIESLNQELEETADRIDELNKKDNLTLIEQGELQQLSEANDELERQLRIKQEEAKIQANILAQTAVETYNKENIQGKYATQGTPVGDPTDLGARYDDGEDERQYYERQLVILERLIEKKRDNIELTLEENNQYQKAYAILTELNNTYDPILKSLQDKINLNETLSSEEQYIYDLLTRQREIYNDLLDPLTKVNKAQEELNKLWNSPSFAKARNTLKQLYDANNLNAEAVNRLAHEYPELKGIFDESGLSADAFAEYLRTLFEVADSGAGGSAKSISELAESFQDVLKEIDSFNGALQEQEKYGGVSIETYLDMISANEDLITVFQIENGVITVNKELYKALAIAKLEELRASKLSERDALINKLKEEQSNAAVLAKTYGAVAASIYMISSKETQTALNELNVFIDSFSSVIDGLKNNQFNFSFSDPSKTSKEIDKYKELTDDLQEYLERKEHEIFLLSKQEGTANRQIQIYKEMQEEVHRLADQLRSMGLDDDSEQIRNLQKEWWELNDSIESILKNQSDLLVKNAKTQKDALESVIDLTKKMIKQEADDQIEAIKDQIDGYEKIIQLKKKMLDQSQSESNYQKTIAQKNNEIVKIQTKLSQISLDDSRDAQAERIKLQEQLSELSADLSDYQLDYSYEKQQEALDNELDAFKDTKDKEIKTIESTVDSEVKLYQLAIDRISFSWGDLYQDLLNWNLTYGDGIQANITNKWEEASNAIGKYGSAVNALSSLDSIVSSDSGSSNNTALVKTLVGQMKSNASAWHTSSDSNKQKLSQSNENIARDIEQLLGIKILKGSDGVWYIGSIGGRKLFDTYHQGGVVGDGSNIKQDEVVAILEKGEIVINKSQQSALFKLLEFNRDLYKTINGFKMNLPDMMRSISSSNIINNINKSSNTSGMVFSPTIDVKIIGDGLDKSKAGQYANSIADLTLSKLREGFGKRGLNSFNSALLKP
jgi:TP901 family phage tail tape measure protein